MCNSAQKRRRLQTSSAKWFALGAAGCSFALLSDIAQAGDVGISAATCEFNVQTLHQSEAPVFLLAAGEIDAAHSGPELLAVDAHGTIMRLDAGSQGWSVTPLSIAVETPQFMAVRPTINIGDVHPGFAGNEIVIETFNTVNVLLQTAPGQWQRQIVLDGKIFFGNTWGVRIGDIDPAMPGQELFYITESAGDVSAGWYARLVGGEWTSDFVFGGEVGMDAAIGDINPNTPGNEIIITTEMGPTYEITPQPGSPNKWVRHTLWDDFDNSGWTVRIADILPNLPGNEIAYGTRHNDRLLLSYRSSESGRPTTSQSRPHTVALVHSGAATEATTMWDIAVGNFVLESPSLEIVGVDDLGMAYLARHDGNNWLGQTMWQDAGGALHAVVMADFLPSVEGLEIVVAGASGAITLITRREVVTGDITCDGAVNVDDLLAVITNWGACAPPPASCPADIAPSPGGNAVVNVDDLLMVILNRG